MTKVKAFFYVLKNSLTNLSYYPEILKTKVSFSFKYYFSLSFIAVLILTFSISAPIIPVIRDFSNEFINEAEKLFPDDLIISSSNNEWEINKPEPFSIATPDVLLENQDTSDLEQNAYEIPSNLITFYHDGTINDLEELDTFLLVNSVNLIARDESGKIEAYPLSDLPEGQVTKDDFNGFLNELASYTSYIPQVVYALVFIVYLLYFFFFRLWYLVIVALVLLLMGSLKGLKLTFGNYYRIALHTFTLPMLLEIGLILTGVQVGIPFWAFLINSLFGALVLITMNTENTEQAEVIKPENSNQ